MQGKWWGIKPFTMRFIFTILSLGCFLIACAQSDTISIEGMVKDFQGTPVNWATIKVKHTSRGTSTNWDGGFRLNGIKIGDTLIFTSVSWQKAYFIVQRKYNVLNFKLIRDTTGLFIKEYAKTSFFGVNSSTSRFNEKYKQIEFFETDKPARDLEEKYSNYIFTKVEVNPYFYSGYPKFTDSLTSDINKLKANNKPIKTGIILVYIWIRGDNKIEINSILGDIKNEVREVIEKRLMSITNIYSAVQNGRTVGVLAVAKFEVNFAADKSILLTMVNQ